MAAPNHEARHETAAQYRRARCRNGPALLHDRHSTSRSARRFGTGFVELEGWPATVYLLAKDAGTIGAGGDPRRYSRHWTPVHADIVVDDVDAAVERAVAAGAKLEAPAKDAAYGRIAMLADPFGHGFCLLQFNERGYDALL